jgi:hypothetical protein
MAVDGVHAAMELKKPGKRIQEFAASQPKNTTKKKGW